MTLITENGWPQCAANELDTGPVPGTHCRLEVRAGDAATILKAWAAWYHQNVEPIDQDGQRDWWGWTATNSVWNSNHLSGTAIDLCAVRYPWKTYTMSAEKIAKVREGLDLFEGTVFWGRDWGQPEYRSSPDEMHYQIQGAPQDVAPFAAKLRAGHLGLWGPAASNAEPAPTTDDQAEPAVWADVSEWQRATLDESYPHEVFCFRTNDGDHEDLRAHMNATAAKAMLDAGRLRCVIAYYFFRPGRANCDLHKTMLERAGLWGDPRLVTMVDLEGDRSTVRGDQSAEVNDEINRLRQWHGDPRRVIGYWNPVADPGLWRTRPAGLRLVIPQYNGRPGDLSHVPEPYRSEAVAHQHTDSGACPPFGNCDLNQSLIPLPALLTALGIPTTQKEPVLTDNAAHLDRIEQKIDLLAAQLGPWPQTGNRTLLDTTAAVAAKLAVPGARDTLAA